MDYAFYCQSCNKKETISMRMSEYVSTGHLCTDCNTELLREPSSLVCGVSIDNTGSFFKRSTI